MDTTIDSAALLADSSNLRTLAKSREWVPNDGKPVSTSTLFRWANKGVSGVRLAVLRTPRGTYTSQAAVNDFLTRIDAVRKSEQGVVESATEQQLRDAGLLGGDS